MGLNKKSSFVLFISFLFLLLTMGCQMQPTAVVENDGNLERRSFSKIDFKSPIDFKRAVIVDVRSRFDYEMSKLPRSFHVFWKDWDLSGYTEAALQGKGRALQRQLSLHGVDPLTQVVILGNGLLGQGEEFFMATVLHRLGIKRISIISQEKVKKALTSKENLPLTNLPSWNQKVLPATYECSETIYGDLKFLQADYIILSKNDKKKENVFSPAEIFDKNLNVLSRSWIKKKNLIISSPQSFWAYGLASALYEQGREVCLHTDH